MNDRQDREKRRRVLNAVAGVIEERFRRSRIKPAVTKERHGLLLRVTFGPRNDSALTIYVDGNHDLQVQYTMNYHRVYEQADPGLLDRVLRLVRRLRLHRPQR